MDSTFAIQKMSMSVPNRRQHQLRPQNLPRQEFKQLADSSGWFLAKDKFVVDFWTPSPKPTKTIEFIGRKTTTYEGFILNDTAVTNRSPKNRYPPKHRGGRQRAHADGFLLGQPPPRIAEPDMTVDLQNGGHAAEDAAVPEIFQYHPLPGYGIYKPFGPLEWGPYWYLFSQNRLEGSPGAAGFGDYAAVP
ncbi:hypothetical protein [Chitinophaga caseinilytica]|uniref:hypothetical protein n=1 Tax=Chitinophaga caseinilytica TaxID=2267521 RepID=UPI003C2E7F2E